MLVRTQVSLETEQHRHAKRRAAELGVSLAEYIRRAVARDLGEVAPAGDVSAIFGLFDSGGSDVARHKDEYLADAVWAEHVERVGPASDDSEDSGPAGRS